MLTAAAHEGSGTCGKVKRTCPGTPRWPKRISITILMAMTSRPRRRKNVMERDHGALLRRAETTTHATTPINARRNGLFVRMAQIARPAAQSHHATGCRERRRGAAARVIPRPASAAIGQGRTHPGHDDDCDQDDREQIARRSAARTPVWRLRWRRPTVPRGRSLAPGPRAARAAEADVVVVAPAAAARGRGASRRRDFDLVLTAGVAVATAPARRSSWRLSASPRPVPRLVVVVVLSRADGAWAGGTSVEALQICAYDGATPGGGSLELSGSSFWNFHLRRRQPDWRPIALRGRCWRRPTARGSVPVRPVVEVPVADALAAFCTPLAG